MDYDEGKAFELLNEKLDGLTTIMMSVLAKVNPDEYKKIMGEAKK